MRPIVWGEPRPDLPASRGPSGIKTIVDLRFHLREHGELAARPRPA